MSGQTWTVVKITGESGILVKCHLWHGDDASWPSPVPADREPNKETLYHSAESQTILHSQSRKADVRAVCDYWPCFQYHKAISVHQRRCVDYLELFDCWLHNRSESVPLLLLGLWRIGSQSNQPFFLSKYHWDCFTSVCLTLRENYPNLRLQLLCSDLPLWAAAHCVSGKQHSSPFSAPGGGHEPITRSQPAAPLSVGPRGESWQEGRVAGFLVHWLDGWLLHSGGQRCQEKWAGKSLAGPENYKWYKRGLCNLNAIVRFIVVPSEIRCFT